MLPVTKSSDRFEMRYWNEKYAELRLIPDENRLQLRINGITLFILWKYLYKWTCTSFSWSWMVKRSTKSRMLCLLFSYVLWRFFPLLLLLLSPAYQKAAYSRLNFHGGFFFDVWRCFRLGLDHSPGIRHSTGIFASGRSTLVRYVSGRADLEIRLFSTRNPHRTASWLD